MKQLMKILMLSMSAVFLFSSGAFAAPTIDGVMEYTDSDDWGGLGTNTVSKYSSFVFDSRLTNVSVEEGDASGGGEYDAEELGLYIADGTLYFGLQTEFNLDTGEGNLAAGDLIFSFSSTFTDDNTNTYGSNNDDDFAFSFSITDDGSVTLTLLSGNMVGSGAGTSYNNYDTDWSILSADKSVELTNATDGVTLAYSDEVNGSESSSCYTPGYTNGQYTLEGSISLDILYQSLGTLLTSNTSVTMYWQPECGNDFLAATATYSYSSTNDNDPVVPEPETLLLFGFGLIGASIFGRKRFQA